MSKDRARPFSRKHRRYWISITGGMLLIGAINVSLGLCAYERPPPPPQRIVFELPPPGSFVPTEPGAIALGAIPAVVMRGFAAAFPRQVPRSARRLAGPDGAVRFELRFGAGTEVRRVQFHADGAPVGD